MSNSLYTCNCDVIHEDIVNDVKGKMQPKDDYIQLASLFKLFEMAQECRSFMLWNRARCVYATLRFCWASPNRRSLTS